MRLLRSSFFLTPDFPTYNVFQDRVLTAPGATVTFQNYDTASRSISFLGATNPAGPWTYISSTLTTVASGGTAVLDIPAQVGYNFIQASLAGSVSNVAVVNGGTGYTSAPTVSFTGGSGTGATATASIYATSSVASATVTAGGTLYTSPPSVTFSAPPSGVTATGVAVVSGGAVTAVTIVNPGSGYVAAPSISFSGGGGSGAAATAVLTTASGPVVDVVVTAGGSGYVSDPTVVFTGGGGTGAVASASLQSLSNTSGGVEVEFVYSELN